MDDDTGRALVPWKPPEEDVITIRTAEPAPRLIGEKRTPARSPDLVPDVAVPGLQALLTAICAGLAVWLIVLALGAPARWALVIGGVTLLVSWLARLRVVDALLWQVESITRLDGSPPAGQPPAPATFALVNPAAARSELATDAQQEAKEAGRLELLTFLDACFIRGCSEAAHGVKATGPDRRRYTANRDALMALGVAAWRKPGRPRAGWALTCSRQRARQVVERHVL